MSDPQHTASGHLNWDAEGLWRQVEPILPGLSVEVVARTGSTNTQLLERARVVSGRRDQPITTPGALGGADEPPGPHGRRAGDTQPCLLVAEHQTRGRGRLGRVWQSSPGASLTFSLGLALAPRDWSGLSLAVGVALADALDPLSPEVDGGTASRPRLGLKWPNDLWLIDDETGDSTGGRKLGGVLIESVAVGRNRMVVVGVGLNILPQPMRDVSSGFASLNELDPAASAPRALHCVALPLAQALVRYENEGFAPFVEGWARRDLLSGRRVSTTLADVPDGTAEGVDDDGALRLRTPDGQCRRIVSGEVSVRPIALAPGA